MADSQEKKIIAFDLYPNGKATNERVFIANVEGTPDGLRVAENGNVYIACKGVAVYTPGGKFVRMFEIPETPTNCELGGADRKTLYVTARTSIYSLRVPDCGR